MMTEARPAGVDAGDSRQAVRVVLIEDNPGDVRLIRELLSDVREARFEICHADRLKAGLQLLGEVAPDVVVLDLGLPDCSGLAPVETLRERAPDLPIIVLTGSHDRMLAMETIRAGAHYCLVKDQVYSGAELSLALRYAIERQQLTAELHRRTEQANASEARLRTILEHEADGVVVLDERAVVRFANPAALALVAGADGTLVGEPFGWPLRLEERSEIDLVTGGDTGVVVEMRIAEAEWEGRRAFIASLRDVTERKRLEAALRRHAEELEEKNSELDAFAYSISHDLKEPVRSVTMFSGFLVEDCAGRLDASGLEYLERIQNAGALMGRMIDDLLALAQVVRQARPPARVDVRPVIEEALQRLRGAIEAKGATVRVAPDLPDIRADAARVSQVFGNLISNALKFNEGDRPLVEVGTDGVRDGVATFFVRDNGIGIAPEFHDRVFGLFQRLNARERYEGTGVGLSIVKRVIEHYGGQIGVDSEPGRGTTFTFTLPAWVGGEDQIPPAGAGGSSDD